MSSGVYGVIRGADVRPQDVEIFLHYSASRTEAGDPTLSKLDPNTVLKKTINPNNTTSTTPEIFGGLYTLELPVDTFNVNGFYTIVIKPKEIRTSITACGTLQAFHETRGIIFDMNTIDDEDKEAFQNNNLVGYRVEYIKTAESQDERKVQNYFTLITSNNLSVPTYNNDPNVQQQTQRYLFDDSSTLSFCTVTPSSAFSVKPNSFPQIGEIGQEVIITNTFFDPFMVEIEMVEHDIETLAYALLSNQTKSLEDGIYTIYNFNNEIYQQSDLYEIKEEFSGKPLFEVREKRSSIDFTKQFNNITNL